MPTTLCFDFGNTRLKCAVFENREFKTEIILEEASAQAIEKIITDHHADRSILSSVINHPAEIETVLSKHTHFHKLGHNSTLPFTTPVGKPETIGADRLAICAAAVDLFPGKHNLAIGLGTCITYNYINNKHEFLGGAISPGMQMRFRAMHEQTALLPMVKADANFPLVGYDTKTNLQSGVLLGMAKEIDGFVDAYAEKYSNINVLLTGGDMHFFVAHLKNKIFAEPYLIYKGLNAICEHNQ